MINRIIFAPALEKALECPANKLEKKLLVYDGGIIGEFYLQY